ncbi:MAG: chloride channel protein [Candidatus Promineifilaceae bacterium]|nr:chloride channel protein [Candidatus Promineifilaceae bacterium]
MFFSLLVGLAQKYLNAPNAIEGDALDPMVKGDTKVYKTFWGALATSFASLLSGASVGPEGPLGYLAVDIAAWLSVRFKLSGEGLIPAAMAGISAAYNGLIGNSVFSAVMASETEGGKGGLPQLAANLAAGSVGFLVFRLLGVPAFAGALSEGEPFDLSVELVIWAIILGLIGAVLAVYTGVAMRVFGTVMGRFEGRPILRVMVAGVIIAIVGYFIPDLLFSGEASLGAIVANPAQTGIAMLLILALVKPLLLALSLKSGYLGGPIFPLLFSAIMIGLALSLLFPDMPVGMLTACLQVAVITLALNAPLTSILLVTVITGADANLLELIVVSGVTAMITGQVIRELMTRRSAVLSA